MVRQPAALPEPAVRVSPALGCHSKELAFPDAGSLLQLLTDSSSFLALGPWSHFPPPCQSSHSLCPLPPSIHHTLLSSGVPGQFLAAYQDPCVSIFVTCLVMARLICGVLGVTEEPPDSELVYLRLGGYLVGCPAPPFSSYPAPKPHPLSTTGSTCVSSRLSWITCVVATPTPRGAPGW